MVKQNSEAETSGSGKKSKDRARAPLIEKFAQWMADYRLPLAAVMLVAALILGYIGNYKYLAATGESNSIWDISYYTIRLLNPAALPLQGPVNIELQIARLLAAVAAFYITIEALLSIFRDQVQALRVRGMKGHTIICGMGQKGVLLADKYRTQGEQVVVIENDEENPMAGHCMDKGAVVLMGDAADPQLLRKARIFRAQRIIAVCGNDGVNAEVALHARQLVEARNGRALLCLAHIVDLQLWWLLRERELRMGTVNSFRLSFFNIYQSGARALLYDYPPLKEGAPKGNIPHMLVVGMGRLGESLVINAAKGWRNSGNIENGRLRISIVDMMASSKKETLCARYPQLEDACELRAFDMEAGSAEFALGDYLYGQNGKCEITGIYICLGDETAALTAALKLNRRLKPQDIPIVVRMKLNAGLSKLLQETGGDDAGQGHIHAFPLLERTCVPEFIWGGSTNEMLARAIHGDYVRNALKRGDTPQSNPSIVPWEKLSGNLKESNRNQAEYITSKLRQFGYDFDMATDWDLPLLKFLPEEVEEMAKLEHTRFVDERVRNGWKLGPAKDDVKKISPTLIPWDDLSEVEKDKDRDPVRAIPALLAKAGYTVYRSKKPA
jgi:hypothetical protein